MSYVEYKRAELQSHIEWRLCAQQILDDPHADLSTLQSLRYGLQSDPISRSIIDLIDERIPNAKLQQQRKKAKANGRRRK